MIISVINQKGGVGKTVTAFNLGAALAAQGHRVAFVDTDAQESLYRYRNTFKNAKFYLSSIAALPVTLTGILNADYVIIDIPKSVDDTQAADIMKVCELALISTEPEYDSSIATVRTVEVAKQVQGINSKLQYRVLLTKNSGARHRKLIRAEIKSGFADCLCKAAIPNNTLFGEAATYGKTILEHAPDSTAARAVVKLADEVQKMKVIL